MIADNSAWLAAQYHMPLLYSCRVPMTSPLSGRALPAPGPATIQLALLRVGIELFGLERSRNELLPVIVGCFPLVRPPDEIAISNQLVKAFKARDSGSTEEGLAYREYVHARGNLTIYVPTLVHLVDLFTTLLRGIGYFGQTDSFATCVSVREAHPEPGSVAQPLGSFKADRPLGQYYTSFVTELRDERISWEELNAEDGKSKSSALRTKLHVWPLTVCEHSGAGQRLRYRKLPTATPTCSNNA